MDATKVIATAQAYKKGELKFSDASLQLIELGCSADEVGKLLGKLDKPEYYLNVNTGDLYLINWVANRPVDDGNWVEISENCYNIISGNIAHFQERFK